MPKLFAMLIISIAMTACNTVYMVPESLDTTQRILVAHGGLNMRNAAKQEMRDRGYDVVVAKAKTLGMDYAGGDFVEFDTYEVPSDVKYAVHVRERYDTFSPVWCVFNGFWWWRFNLFVTDLETGEEIANWAGHGCANSSVRKLRQILDAMEMPAQTPVDE